MNNEHPKSDEVLDLATIALSKGHNWVAYNNSLYFIDKEDVQFFKNETEAKEFANDNISDRDSFHVMNISSVEDVLRQVPYAERLRQELSVFSGNEQSINNSSKITAMNEQNFEYLKDNIKYMGFGENMNEALETNLKQGTPEFILSNKTEINKKPFEATLHFRKSDNSDMYFFNSYNASLERKNGEKMEQTFYLNKGKGITAKEAYNMLEGRAVFKELSTKEGQGYKAWVQLDFDNKAKNNNHEVKQFHENYGYDLKAAVSKFAVAELADSEKEKSLMQSLQKGNIQAVTIEKEGSVSKIFVEANPQYKSVNLYDGSMQRVQKESLDQYLATERVAGKDQKTDLSHEVNDKKKLNGKEQEQENGTKKEMAKSMLESKEDYPNHVGTKITKVKVVKELLPQKERNASKKSLKVS